MRVVRLAAGREELCYRDATDLAALVRAKQRKSLWHRHDALALAVFMTRRPRS